MKGIILEYDKNDAIILTDDGLFKRIKNNNYAIGQRIEIKEVPKKGRRFVTGIASLAAALAITTIGSIAYYTPTDYISLDVNPSIEYTLNTFDRVLDVKAVNEDGEAILSGLKMNNMSIDDAVKITLDELIAEGYLTDEPDSGVIITASNKKLGNAEAMAAKLQHEVKDYLIQKENIAAEVEAEAVGKEKAQEAKALGVTPGKLTLVEKLQSSTNSAIDRDEWLNKPVKEINSAIKENKKHNKGNNNNKDNSKNLNRGKDNIDIEKDRTADRDNSKEEDKDKDKDIGNNRGNNNKFNNYNKDDNNVNKKGKNIDKDKDNAKSKSNNRANEMPKKDNSRGNDKKDDRSKYDKNNNKNRNDSEKFQYFWYRLVNP